MSLSEIAFEQIQGNYYWGKYGDFKVVVDRETGHINATHLCKLGEADHGKSRKFNDWSRSGPACDLIGELASTGIPVDDILKVVTGGKCVEIRGTYAHQDLIPHIASWASFKFAIKVSRIVNEHLVREYKISLLECRETIKVKDDTIDKLTTKVDDQSRRIDELLKLTRATYDNNVQLLDEMQEVKGELVDVKDELQEKNQINLELVDEIAVANHHAIAANKTVEAIAKKLDVATDQRVPPAASRGIDEVFGVFHKPGTSSYRMVRRQKRTYAGGKLKCTQEGFTACIYESDSPNAVNLGHRIKELMDRSLGRVSGPTITLAAGKTPADLLEFITAAEREKKQV
jgi:hypothetical protein